LVAIFKLLTFGGFERCEINQRLEVRGKKINGEWTPYYYYN
jgi:hypothetical protein